jgi:carboxylesterase
MLPDAEVTAVSLEFGTYPARKVLRALTAENWLHHHGESGNPDAGTIREDLREAFDPDSGEWRERVWSQGGEIIGEALSCPRSEASRGKYMEGAEPLFLEGGERGLLLLHGAGGGTAWDMKEFAATANRRGWTVWLPSLPGFGTRPEDLIGVTAGGWLDESRNGVDRLAAECTTVAVVGHSVGGALALLLAAEDERITRTVAWSAPWKINNRLLPLLPLVNRIPLIRRLVPERVPVDTPAALKDKGWVGYGWLPGSIGHPVLDVLKKLHEGAGKITSPVFLVQGTGDTVIDSASADRIQEELAGSEKKSWIIDGGSHVLMQGPRKDELFARTLAFIEEGEASSFP